MKKPKVSLFYVGKKQSTDIPLAIACVLLAIFGIFMIYSASSYSAQITYGDKFFFVKKQIIGVVLGIIALVVFSHINYNIFSKFKIIFLIVGALLLVAVLIPGISISTYGARRWISIAGFSFQPSEVSKFCFVLYSASTLAKKPDGHQTVLGAFKVIAVGLCYCFLIMLEPNMSVTMLLAFVMIVMLFMGGLKLSRFFLMSVPAVLGVVALILLEPYRLRRLVAFINPWESPLGEGYQLIQSLYCFGAGGLFGVGYGNSRQKYLFLPFSESDFIFSIIGEEFGLIGCGIVLCIFAFIVYRGFKIAFSSKNRFGCYLAIGISSVLAVQVLLNVAVVTGSIPPTGLPLPFISAGSTSIIVFMASMGILLNVGKQNKNYID